MADTLTSPMHVAVITPEGSIYENDGVEMVVARALDGEFAVMKNHLPIAAALETCSVRIKKGREEQRLAVFGGFLDMKDNVVSIVSPMAELAETIDVARAQESLRRAEERLANKTTDLDAERAKMALQRALVRLYTAGKL